MDEQICETKEEEVIDEGTGESEMEKLILECGWGRCEGTLFQRPGKAQRKDRYVILI